MDLSCGLAVRSIEFLISLSESDAPLLCERSNVGTGIPENQMVTDLYLPLA